MEFPQINIKFRLLCLILAFLNATSAYGASIVTDLSIKNSQIILSMSDIAEYKVFSLKNPHRLVVDLEDTSWLAGEKKVSNNLIKGVRKGEPEPGKLRIVFDLKDEMKILDKNFFIPQKASSSHRLVISFGSKKLPAKPEKIASKKFEYKTKTPIGFPTFKPIDLKNFGYKSTLKKPLESSNIDVPVKKPVFYKPMVVIDAGHGGVDPGAIGKSGIHEKRITLQFALSLKSALERTGRYRVSLTRKGDYFVSLNNRVKKAQKANGDLFISLHADSHPNSKTRGLSVYTLSERRAKWEAEKLARKANKEEVIRGVDLSDESSDVQRILIDLAQRQTKNTSASFAEVLVKELGDDAKLLDRAHRFAGFAVLTGVDIPSVLVELGYLSNKHEERLLRTKEYRRKLIKGIKDAIDKYFSNYKQ